MSNEPRAGVYRLTQPETGDSRLAITRDGVVLVDLRFSGPFDGQASAVIAGEAGTLSIHPQGWRSERVAILDGAGRPVANWDRGRRELSIGAAHYAAGDHGGARGFSVCDANGRFLLEVGLEDSSSPSGSRAIAARFRVHSRAERDQHLPLLLTIAAFRTAMAAAGRPAE